MLRKKHARRLGKPVGLYTIRHGKPAADGKDVFTMEQSEKTLVLTEQIYRACTINVGMKYHK